VAQDQGYMHLLRLGSKSVNYANKIITQDSKTETIPTAYQLMKNMSLSNISDAGSIQSDEEILQLRRYSAEKMPLFTTQMSFSNQNGPSRKESFDYRYNKTIFSLILKIFK
jgi:hypothetical protein